MNIFKMAKFPEADVGRKGNDEDFLHLEDLLPVTIVFADDGDMCTSNVCNVLL